MRHLTAIISIATVLTAVVILSSCLHEPTESNFVSSRSNNLRIYEATKSTTYNIDGVKTNIVKNSDGEPYVVEQDAFGNFTNCDTPYNEAGKVCLSNTKFKGSLRVEWNEVPDLPLPFDSSTSIPVLNEVWTLSLDYVGANGEGDGAYDEVYSTSRYISQVKSGATQGQLSVHAYDTQPPSGSYYWINDKVIDYTLVDLPAQTTVNSMVMQASPLDSTVNLSAVYNVLQGCDGVGVVDCTPVAKVTRAVSYQQNTEELLTAFGNLKVYFVSQTSTIERQKDVLSDIDLGYEFENNCKTEAAGTAAGNYGIRGASYSGDMSVFPDIGPVRMRNVCQYTYVLQRIDGGVVQLDGSNSTNALNYVWTMLNKPVASKVVLNNANTMAPTFIADQVGLYEFSLVVFDGTNSSVQDKVFINVIDAPGSGNTPPVSNAGPNQNVLTNSVVGLVGSASFDVDDGDTVTHLWTLLNVPPGSNAVLSDSTAVLPTFTADVAGTYEIQLVVNDGKDNSAPDLVYISAVSSGASQLPLANAGPNQNVIVGTIKPDSINTFISYDAVIVDTEYPLPDQ